MNADVYFTTGSTHRICQDYALVKTNYAKSYGLISDGCSAAADSDFGSRLLVKAAEKHVFESIESFLKMTLSSAVTFCRTLELDLDCLCATLLLSRIEEDAFVTHLVGDGFIAGIHKDGSILLHQYEFASGAPYYLRYEHSEEVKQQYFVEFGNRCTKTTYRLGLEVEKIAEEVQEFNETVICFTDKFPLSEYNSVATMSDGMGAFVRQEETITSKANKTVPATEIIKEFLAFKGYFTSFVQRRSLKAMKNFRAAGYQNYDDLSIVVITQREE